MAIIKLKHEERKWTSAIKICATLIVASTAMHGIIPDLGLFVGCFLTYSSHIAEVISYRSTAICSATFWCKWLKITFNSIKLNQLYSVPNRQPVNSWADPDGGDRGSRSP